MFQIFFFLLLWVCDHKIWSVITWLRTIGERDKSNVIGSNFFVIIITIFLLFFLLLISLVLKLSFHLFSYICSSSYIFSFSPNVSISSCGLYTSFYSLCIPFQHHVYLSISLSLFCFILLIFYSSVPSPSLSFWSQCLMSACHRNTQFNIEGRYLAEVMIMWRL
jgi:hypothetical protein